MRFRRTPLKLPFSKLRPKKEDREPAVPAPEDIKADMEKRAGVIKFDLSDDKWMNDPDTFWGEFKHTGEILVPDDFEKWLIGQERMKEEFFMNLEEWVRKMKDIQELRNQLDSSKENKDAQTDKDVMKRFLRERPGPYLLFVGEPGTGKSLLIKIANSKLKKLYKEHGIELQDVLLIKNPRNHQRPIPKYLPAGKGKLVREYQERSQAKNNLKMTVIKSFLGFVMLVGALLIATAMFLMAYVGATQDPDVAWFQSSGIWLQFLLYGMFLIVFPLIVLVFFSMGGGGGGLLGRGKKASEGEDVPALIVDNSGDPDLFVDMTQSNASKMFGSIQHDPWQSGGLGTPAHHRMQAGALHEADKKILYADEFKNFLMNEQIVIEFLTPLEEGMYPIRGREWAGAAGNASLAGETDAPIDCAFFLIAAANYDAIPLLNKYPALRNRYFDIVRAEDEIPATPQNEIKIAQFLADEAYRFKTPSVCAEAVKTVIAHARRKGSAIDKMRLKMRPYIMDLKKAAQVVWSHGDRRHPEECACGLRIHNMIHREDMILAIEEYAKPIEQQILDAHVDRRRPYRLIDVSGSQEGQVNGLVVMGESDEGRTGDVATITAWFHKVDDPRRADFIVTGAPVEDKDTWMQNSIRTVRTTIYRLYGIDLAKEYYVHVSFVQSDAKGIDGPSAGITMTLALMSLLGDPRLPPDPRSGQRRPILIRQDTAVTGTVENLGAQHPEGCTCGLEGSDVKVGPIGGVFEKVYGAKKWNIPRVVIPKENHDQSYFERLDKRKEVEVLGASTVLEYLDLIRAEAPDA